ncbi:MAG: energy-coupling factor ABC transporter permease [Fimbriimonadaceae bacterium]|nr:energy-coupling factor ABC transporter permease [Alphaproteobacteria bacterium]
MHIEPGYVAPAKLIFANAAAVGVFAWYGKEQLKQVISSPWILAKTAAATVFFSLFMQSFHMPVGPSELHFVGAMAMYLTFGFLPTMLGFAIGLLLQGLLFEPTDLVHLGVNSLSLMLPLITVHALKGKDLFSGKSAPRLSWAKIVQLDAIYYAGVTAMVGFWLMIGEVQTPFASWATFAASYLAIVAVEPVVTWLAVNGLKRLEKNAVVANLFVVNKLRLA